MVRSVVANLMTPSEQSLNVAPVEELYRGKVQHPAAESGHCVRIALIHHAGADVEAARESVGLQHFRGTDAVLKPVVDADHDIRGIQVASRKAVHRFGGRHDPLPLGLEVLDKGPEVCLFIREDVVQIEELHPWGLERIEPPAGASR